MRVRTGTLSRGVLDLTFHGGLLWLVLKFYSYCLVPWTETAEVVDRPVIASKS